MAAVWIRLRAELRSGRRAWLGLALVAGLLAGPVIATVAAARRTDSAVERHRAASESVDVWAGRSDFFGLKLDLERVERLPQVAAATRSVDLAFWGRTDTGVPVTNDDVELGVATSGLDGAQRHPKVLEGRAPAPDAVDEVFVGDRAAEAYGLRVGSTLRMRFTTPRELERIAETGENDLRADPETTGSGPLVTLRVVGIRADVQSEDGLMYMTLPKAFYERYRPALGTWLELSGVWLKRGDADLDAFRAGVERIAGGNPVELFPKRTIQASLKHSIHFQVQALWMLAVLGGLAVVLLIGQAVARHTALESADHPLLRSLGMTRTELLALGVGRVLPVAVAAGVLAGAVAYLISPLAPIGAARIAEPAPGLAIDAAVLVAGGAVTAAFVLLVAVVPAWRASSAPVDERSPRSSRVGTFLARAGVPLTGVAGVRMALEPGRGPTAVPVRSTLVSAVIGIAAVAAALTITASADRLLTTPRLYGQNWDAQIGNGNVPGYSREFTAGLRADRSIGELAAGTVRDSRLDGRPTAVFGLEAIRGPLSLTVLEGRAPAAPDEILLGSTAAAALDARVGDTVEGRLAGRARPVRVVGHAVLPEVGFTAISPVGLGEGAVMTFEGLKRFDPTARPQVFVLDVAPGADRAATLARLERDAAAIVPSRPAEVGNWGRVSSFPYLLAGVVAVGAAGVLAHALVTSIRRRRRDLAILKALGLERRQLAAMVAWQATTIAAVGLLIGVPLGVGIGRFAWNILAADLGVVPEVVAPVVAGLLLVPGALLLANLVALPLGRVAARTRPAAVLRAE